MDMTTQIVVPEGMTPKEWFKTTEFAAGVKSTPHAINQWIHRHPEFAEKYCQNISTNPARKKWLIYWEGISIFLAKRDRFRGNRFKSPEPLVTRGSESAVERVGEKANEAIKIQNSQDPIIANLQAMIELRQNQLATNERVEQLEKRVEEVVAIATSPIPVTAGQRQFLNDRVRKYCMEHDLPYHIVWRQIHDHVGVIAVHKYELKHYQAALKYLEKMYIETGLIW